MDLTQLANLGEFIGGVAVLVTLVYLVIQVRQGNANERAASRQTLIATWSDMIADLGREYELCRITGQGVYDYENLSEDDRARFGFIMAKSIMNVYNGVLLHKQGMLDRETLDYFAGFIASALRCDGFAAFWGTFPAPRELKDYVDEYEARHGDAIPRMEEHWPGWIRSWDPKTGSAAT